MKKLGLILTLLIPSILLSQSGTYVPGGVTNPPYNYNNGATGEVTRTLQAKLADFLSVKDFGATGNGVTDDAAAIQAAITASSVGGGTVRTVFFPKGTYAISTPLLLNVNYDYLEFANASLLVTCSSCSAIQVTAKFITIDHANIMKSASTTGVVGVEVNPGGTNVADGLVLTTSQVNGNGSGDQFANAVLIHTGSATACGGGPCTSDHTLIDSGFYSFCGSCVRMGDSTGPTLVNYTHIRGASFLNSTNGVQYSHSAFSSAISNQFTNISGTAKLFDATSDNHDNAATNMEFVGNGTDINVGAGVMNTLFISTTLNHAKIVDAGTNTSYVSTVELTTGAASIINGHVGAIGAAPGITCSGGTFSAGAGSNDTAGTMITNGANTTCTTTFAIAYTNAPACVFIPVTGGSGLTTTVSATNIVMSQASGVRQFAYSCIGH